MHDQSANQDRVQAPNRTGPEGVPLLYAITHDLQTPLAVILASLDQIASSTKGNQSIDRPLTRARASAQRIADAITELMSFAEGSRGDAALASIDLGSLAIDVASDLLPLATHAGVMLIASGEGEGARGEAYVVAANHGVLRRCLENVITNAIRFAAKSTSARRVELTIHQNAGRVAIHVQDTGPGIHPDQLAHALAPFARLAPASSGTGLGLAIVREHMARFGGSIRLESDGRSGTLAILDFPLAPQSAAPTRQSRSRAPQPGQAA